MIIKLLPKQIAEFWDSIRYGVINAIAPIIDPTPENIQDILIQLMKQDMQCWCLHDEDKQIYGYVTTSIQVDANVKYRTLVIYSLFVYKKMSSEMWENGMSALEEFAKANDCNRITAYTSNDVVISVAKKFGMNSNYSFLIKDI